MEHRPWPARGVKLMPGLSLYKGVQCSIRHNISKARINLYPAPMRSNIVRQALNPETTNMNPHALLRLALILTCGILLGAVNSGAQAGTPTVLTVFADDTIHFDAKTPSKYAHGSVTALDNGREITRTLTLAPSDPAQRLAAHLILRPIPKDEVSVWDPWDRAGNIRLSVPGQPDVEVIKFVTAYGGRAEYRVDVTDLAPILKGELTFKAFIDTWVSPAWVVDFSLETMADSLDRHALWVLPVAYEPSFTRERYGDSGLTRTVTIPEGQKRVLLHYFVSGHCTDGQDADEFVKKDNVISVDGVVVYRYQPWREDCREFRAVNPYTRRWSDGSWSCDYNRSGWCPGDYVRPLELDLTDHLTPGTHTVRFAIENVRPKDKKGQFGYWRVSAQLLGTDQ